MKQELKNLRDYFFYRIFLPKPLYLEHDGWIGKEENAQNSGALPIFFSKNTVYCRQFRGYNNSGNIRIIWYLFQGRKQIGVVTVIYKRAGQYGYNNSHFEWKIKLGKKVALQFIPETKGIGIQQEILENSGNLYLEHISQIWFAEKIYQD